VVVVAVVGIIYMYIIIEAIIVYIIYTYIIIEMYIVFITLSIASACNMYIYIYIYIYIQVESVLDESRRIRI